MQKTLQDQAAAGETIVVSEAVVAASVPDITPEVRSAVGEFIKRNPPPRVSGMMGAPAMLGLAPTLPQSAQPMQAPAPAPAPVFGGGGGLLPGGGQCRSVMGTLSVLAEFADCVLCRNRGVGRASCRDKGV